MVAVAATSNIAMTQPVQFSPVRQVFRGHWLPLRCLGIERGKTEDG
jgi:hypothetical protein